MKKRDNAMVSVADSLVNLTTEEILSMHSYLEYRKGALATLRSTTETIKDEEAKRCSELEGVNERFHAN